MPHVTEPSSEPGSIAGRVLMLAGLASYWTCSSISRNDYIIFNQTSSSSDVDITFLVFVATLLLCGSAAFFWRRQVERVLANRRAVVGIASALASVAVVPMLFTSPGDGAYWVLRALSCCYLTAWYLLITFAWGAAVANMGAQRASMTVMETYALSCALASLFLLPSPWLETVTVAMPVATGLIWTRCPVREIEDLSFKPSAIKNFPVLAVVMCGVFYCASGVVRDYLSYEDFETSWYLKNLVPFVVNMTSALILFVSFTLGFRKGSTWQRFYTALVVAVIVFFACLFAVILGWAPAAQGGEQVISASYMCFKVLLWIFITIVACDLNVSTVTAFSVFFVAMATAFMAAMGIVLPSIVALTGVDIYAERWEALTVTAFVLIALTLVFLLQYVARNERAVVESSQQTSRHGALEQIAQERHLTPREVDVATLVLQGYSIKMVAKLLYISEGTVQTHMKNLYRKLELHSKQELIELVEAYLCENEPGSEKWGT